MRTRVFWLVVLLVLVFTGASCAGKKEGKDTPGTPAGGGLPAIQPRAAGLPEIAGLEEDDIPLCFGPDSQTLYVMKYASSGDPGMKVIVGDYTLPVDLYRVENGQRTKLAAGIPFITLARWSPDGRYLGLAGGRQLYILDPENNRLDSVNELVNLPSVVHFGWSPDGRTVYAEHDTVSNGAVFDVKTRQGLPAYKIKEPLPFFKAKLAENLYLGTVVTGNGRAETVILDGAGQVQKSVAPGNFRDVDGNSILQAGRENFGLVFYPDVHEPEGTVLTGEYVYQCRFLPRGGIIYSTPGEDGAELSYKLTVVTQNEQKTVSVSGPHFQVWPDGRFVDVCGYRSERLSLPDLAVVRRQDRPPYGGETEKIIAAVRGAVTAYLDYYYRAEKVEEHALKEALSRYYTDTREPVEQVALTDVCEELMSRPLLPHLRTGVNHLNGQIDSLEMHGEDRATLVAHFLSRRTLFSAGAGDDPALRFSSPVGGWGFGAACELVRQSNGSWSVTGLSTFPASREREKIAGLAEDFAASAKSGAPAPFRDDESVRLYDRIRGEEIRVGQIQFWNMSEPHRSTNPGQACLALVYLYAGGERYKLVFSREDTPDWQIARLRDFSRPGIM